MNQLKMTAMACLMMGGLHAQAITKYVLTLTNGGSMPISPAAVYAKIGQLGNANVGDVPTPGFIQLCQTGNPATRVKELANDTNVKFVTQTMGPVLPGSSQSIEIEVENPLHQSIQIEAMYGKTKDICSVGSIGSHSLYALKQHVTPEFVSKDNVVQTGAFLDPVLPEGHPYSDMSICENSMTGVSCLRELALPNNGIQRIRFFSSYLPSLLSLLEMKYGAADVQTLVLPSSGAVQIQLKLKH